MEDYYTSDEVAKMCNVSRSSVIRWIQEGSLNASLTVGGHYRILKPELIKLMGTLRLPLPVQEQKGTLERTALIVDDEEPIRTLLRFFLMENFSYFQIEEAADGFEAGIKIQKFKPELILLDLRIPGQDGVSICEQIRSLPEFSNTVIMVVSGIGDQSVRERVLFYGANDYVQKPFDLEDLKAKIDQQIIAAQKKSKKVS